MGNVTDYQTTETKHTPSKGAMSAAMEIYMNDMIGLDDAATVIDHHTAAPELLEALKAWLDAAGTFGWEVSDEIEAAARAAIAKATKEGK